MPRKTSRGASPATPRRETQDTREDIVKRLRRIEGQIRGVQRMVEQDRACRDVLDQLAAIQQAIRGVSALVAQQYAVECIGKVQGDASQTQTQETAADLVDALLRAPR